MADLKYYDVILRPVITERSMRSMSVQVERNKKQEVLENGKKVLKTVRNKAGVAEKETIDLRKYTFLVNPDSNKSQIKEAVEKMFDGVKVESVRTVSLSGKTKRRGRVEGKTAEKKKAIVTLAQDSKDIDLFGNK